MEIIWKEIPGFESYEASIDGNIRNKKTQRLLARCGKNDGYLYVTMYHNKKYYNRSIHTLIAKAFLSNPNNKRTVNHKDRDGHNNVLENLEWATYSEQQKHISNTGGRKLATKREKAVDEPNEVWKKIEHVAFSNGWDYFISNHGRIKDKNERLKVIRQDNRGYCSNKICQHWFSVHCLMVKVFWNLDVDATTVVNHKDGNKSNNNLNNLEVVSQSENIKHAYENGMNIKKNKRAVNQVDVHGNVIGHFSSLTEAENKTGINRGGIHRAIKRGSFYQGYRWVEKIE